MWNKKNKTNKQTRNILIDTESIFTVARWEGCWGGWVKKVKGLRSTDWQLQNSHGDVKYSIGNTVSNSLIPMYGARWV